MALLETYSPGKRKQYIDQPNPGPRFSSKNKLGAKGKRKFITVPKKPMWRPWGENQDSWRVATLLILYNAGLRTKSIHQQFALLWKQKRFIDELQQTGGGCVTRKKIMTKVQGKPVSRSCKNETSRNFNLLQTCHFQRRHDFTWCCKILQHPDAIHPWSKSHIMGCICYNAGK